MPEADFIAAAAAIIAAVIVARFSRQHSQQLSEIHVLVNARLDRALQEIKKLKAEVKFLKTELGRH